MPKKVSYIQCDKDEGRLIHFSSTRHSLGLACGDGGENAEFWICAKCQTIYYRHRESSGSHMGNDPDTYTELRVFDYKATAVELYQLGGVCSGWYTNYDDTRIIETRKEKLSKLKKLEEKIKALKDLTSLDTKEKWLVDESPQKVGEDGLCSIIVTKVGEKEKYAWCKKASGIKKGDNVILIAEKINFKPHDLQECLFALK